CTDDSDNGRVLSERGNTIGWIYVLWCWREMNGVHPRHRRAKSQTSIHAHTIVPSGWFGMRKFFHPAAKDEEDDNPRDAKYVEKDIAVDKHKRIRIPISIPQKSPRNIERQGNRCEGSSCGEQVHR